LEGCHRFVVDVELEGYSMEEIRLEEGDHGDCSLKVGWSALEEGEPKMVVTHGLVALGYLYLCDVVCHSFHGNANDTGQT
jgi:hypothetical protein